jgi:hypothetical protein
MDSTSAAARIYIADNIWYWISLGSKNRRASTWPASPLSRYIGVGALGATVSAGRAEPTDHSYLDIFETNLLSARHADTGQ